MILRKILILILFCVLISPVYSAGIQATPADFKYTLEKGNSSSNTLTIWNNENTPLKIEIQPKRLYIRDKQLNYDDTGIAKWITITKTNFTLRPHEKQDVSFNLTIPLGLDYRDTIGAILIHSSLSNSNVFMDLIIPLHVSVPGPIMESILLLNHTVDKLILSCMKSNIQTELKNNGTIKTNITSKTCIKGLTGEYIISNNIMIYPGDESSLNNVWMSNWWDLGFYQAKTTISYNNFGEEKTTTYNNQIFVIPLWLIFIITGLILTRIYQKK